MPDVIDQNRVQESLLAENHVLAQQTQLTAADLADHPMVLLDAPPSRDYFQNILTSDGVTPNIAFRSTNFEMVRGLVGHGLGYALLATKPASAMTYDGRALVVRPLETAVAPSRVVLATREGTTRSAIGEAFLSRCRDFFERNAG